MIDCGLRIADCGLKGPVHPVSLRQLSRPHERQLFHNSVGNVGSSIRNSDKEGYVYAIVEIAGDQVRVEEGARVRVPRIHAEPGETLEFSDVLLVSGEENTSIGTPTVENATVRAEVLSHGLGEKIIVFKIKRRKNYRRKRGHRQGFTDLLVRDIVVGGESADGNPK